jgi:hypothetical protein
VIWGVEAQDVVSFVLFFFIVAYVELLLLSVFFIVAYVELLLVFLILWREILECSPY